MGFEPIHCRTLVYPARKPWSDWGEIRLENGKLVAKITPWRAFSDEEYAAHRRAGTDPYEEVARRLVDCWNLCRDIPDPAALRRGYGQLQRELETVRESLRQMLRALEENTLPASAPETAPETVTKTATPAPPEPAEAPEPQPPARAVKRAKAPAAARAWPAPGTYGAPKKKPPAAPPDPERAALARRAWQLRDVMGLGVPAVMEDLGVTDRAECVQLITEGRAARK